MIIDQHEIARQLRDLESQISDLRRALDGNRPILDVLSGLPQGNRMDLAAGYTALSPGWVFF